MSKELDPSLDEFILAAIAAIDRVRNFHKEINGAYDDKACEACTNLIDPYVKELNVVDYIPYPCPTIKELHGETE